MLYRFHKSITPTALTNAGRSDTYKKIMSPSFNVTNFITKSAFTDDSYLGNQPNMVKDFVVDYPEIAGEENIQKAFGTYYLSKCGASVRTSKNVEKCARAKNIVRTYGHVEDDLPSFTRSTNFSDYGYIFAEMIKSGVSFRDLGLDRYLLENNKNTSKESGDAWGAAAMQSGLLNTEKVLEAAVRGKIKNHMDSRAREWALMDINLGDGKNWTADAYKIAELLGLVDERGAAVPLRRRRAAEELVDLGGTEDYRTRIYGNIPDRPPPPSQFMRNARVHPLEPQQLMGTARLPPPSQALWLGGSSRRKSQRKKRGRKARRTRRH